MAKILPRVFVGSSSEAEAFARALCNLLKDTAEMVPWRDAPEFKPLGNILAAISEAAFNYDFGLFILSPDDVTESRGKKAYSTRDNVLFELGLFLGELGSDRAIAIMQKATVQSKKVKVPSDLLGIIMPEVASPARNTSRKVSVKEAEVLIQDAANKVKLVIEKHGSNLNMDLLTSFGFIETEKAFAMEIKAEKLAKYLGKVKGKQLVVVTRKDYDGGIAEQDTEIARSKVYRVPEYEPQNMNIKAKGAHIFNALKPGDMIEGYLLLIPPDVDVRTSDTLAEMYKMGCLKICKRGYKIQG